MQTRLAAPSLAIILAACVHEPPPVAVFQDGGHEAALQRQQLLASQPGPGQALERCRLGSMALATGELALAEQALRGAVGSMQDFQAQGEWRAVMGQESAKEWKGEPYEKMLAFLYLGALLHQKGDHGNALAMFKSAVLADAGTVEERYRSDFLPAWLLQALAWQAEGEPESARQSLRHAADGLYSRVLVDLLARELAAVPDTGSRDAAEAARIALLTGLPAGVSLSPREPGEAARAAVSQAGDILRLQLDKENQSRLPALQGFSRRELEEALTVLGPLAEAWRSRAAALPPELLEGPAQRAAAIEGLLDQPPSLLLLLEQGRGPRKVAEGRHQEILRVVPGGPPSRPPRVVLDGAELRTLELDSLSWQATTRGGRQVDGFLRGKAIFKDSSLITGWVLMDLGDAALHSDHDEAAAALYALGLVTWIVGAATNPAADTRQWELVPDGFWLLAADPAPGEHRLSIDGRDYRLHIPQAGQVFQLIPRLPPGGSRDIPSPQHSRAAPPPPASLED